MNYSDVCNKIEQLIEDGTIKEKKNFVRFLLNKMEDVAPDSGNVLIWQYNLHYIDNGGQSWFRGWRANYEPLVGTNVKTVDDTRMPTIDEIKEIEILANKY